jgi:hypothetical protein
MFLIERKYIMKKALLMTLAAATFALPAMAATTTPASHSAATPAAMTKTYDKADFNKDGKVSRKELQQYKREEMAQKHAQAQKMKTEKTPAAATAPATTNQ